VKDRYSISDIRISYTSAVLVAAIMQSGGGQIPKLKKLTPVEYKRQPATSLFSHRIRLLISHILGGEIVFYTLWLPSSKEVMMAAPNLPIGQGQSLTEATQGRMLPQNALSPDSPLGRMASLNPGLQPIRTVVPVVQRSLWQHTTPFRRPFLVNQQPCYRI
jgi:hypothetical protein